MSWKWANKLRRKLRRHKPSIKLMVCPRPSPPSDTKETLRQKKRQRPKPPPRTFSELLGQWVTPYQSPSRLSPTKDPPQSPLSLPSNSSSKLSPSIMSRKLVKKWPCTKEEEKKPTSPLVIGDPYDFKKLSGFELGLPTLEGGQDCGNERIGTELDSTLDDGVSLVSWRTFANESRMPTRSAFAPVPLSSRHTAPIGGSLPRPLKLNPPQMPQRPTRPAPLPPVSQPGGRDAHPPESLRVGYPGDSANTTVKNSQPSRHSVIYGSFEVGSPFFPIIEQVEDIPLPVSGSETSSSTSQILPVPEVERHLESRTNGWSGSFQIHAIGPLPLEMREPQKIYWNYVKTRKIDVDICPEAVDRNNNYTWMHCWSLLNLYTFGASYINDDEFADRVMDLLCEKLRPGQGADLDTITLIFTGQYISTRLKRLVVDRCIDAGGTDFHHNTTRNLPKDFSVFALEVAMERLKHGGAAQYSISPCRYHRHKTPEDCYLRKWAKERDRRVIENRKARKSQNDALVRFDLGPETRHAEKLDASLDRVKEESDGAIVDMPAIDEAVDKEAVVDEAVDDEEAVAEPAADEPKEDDQSCQAKHDLERGASVQEAGSNTSEPFDQEIQNVSTAEFFTMVRPSDGASLISINCKPRPELTRSSSHPVGAGWEVNRRPSLLHSLHRRSLSNASEEFPLPGSYPQSVAG